MANTILTIDMITRELMMQLENNLTFTKQVNRSFDDRFGQTGAKIGDVLTIRLPPLFTGRTGRVANVEALTDQSVALTLDTQFGVDLDFTSKDLELSIDDFSERFLNSAAATIANKIDLDGMALYKDVYNTVGTPGTVPNALLTYSNAGVKLSQESVPRGSNMRAMVINDQMEATLTDALKGLFHATTEVERQYREGTMGVTAGFKWSTDQNVATHTSGVFTTGSTPLVNGASQSGSSLITDGWAASTAILKEGDTFTVGDDVFAVNPRSRQSTGELRRFVVTADTSSDGSGDATIPISPAITVTGPYQTVTAVPDDGDVITMLGAESTASPQALAFHRDAFVLGVADLPLPQGTHQASRISDNQLGISIRMIWDFDTRNDVFICRTDVLYGWVTARPQLACRVAS